MTRVLRHARGTLGLDGCLVMGIVNRTPDSFYDGGRMVLAEAVAYARRLVAQGAEVLDVGAVKAGPGEPVSEAEELRRLLPVVDSLADAGVPLSVETGRPEVASAAVDAGAAIVNDVTGLSHVELAAACAEKVAGLILMHHGGQVRGRPRHPRYSDVVRAVTEAWHEMAEAAAAAGVGEDAIMVDPGLDFSKTTYHSLEIMRRLEELVATGRAVLVAPSRKDIVGESLGLAPDDRLEGTLALVALAARAGAAMVRVHDVRASVRTVAMVETVAGQRAPQDPVRGLWD